MICPFVGARFRLVVSNNNKLGGRMGLAPFWSTRRRLSTSPFRNGMLGFDPYEVLGLKPDCTDTEIKSSFRRLAKESHPDIARDHEENKKKFLQVAQAYEILINPRLRAEYILRYRKQSHAAASANHQRQQATSEKAKFNEGLRRRRGAFYARYDDDNQQQYTAGGRGREAHQAGGEASEAQWLSLLDNGILGALQEEFDAALLHAYLGPRVEGNTIPDSFEAEERRKPQLHPHILEMTSGQQLLGWVTASEERPLIMWNGSNRAKGKKTDEEEAAAAAATSSSSSSAGSDSSTNSPLLHYWDSLTRSEAPDYASLDLVWGGETLARSMRMIEPKSGDDVILVQLQSDQMGSGGTLFAVRGLGKPSLVSKHSIENVSEQRISHVLITHKTPGVRHMHVMQADGAVESRMMRADWRPASEYWSFQPRSLHHDVGGWVIERAAKDRNSQRVCLPPPFYILLCAYRCLDKEAAEGKKGGKAVLKEKVRDWMTQLFSDDVDKTRQSSP